MRREKLNKTRAKAKQIYEDLPRSLARPRPGKLLVEKGASSWLTTLPMKEHFALHKSAFCDAVCIRYNWTPSHLTPVCACGQKFTVYHALTCSTGEFTTIRHNEFPDICGNLLPEVCTNVSREPDLQPLTGEQFNNKCTTSDNGARLNIAANRFWGGSLSEHFFDIQVFNPFVSSSINFAVQTLFKQNARQNRSATSVELEYVK